MNSITCTSIKDTDIIIKFNEWCRLKNHRVYGEILHHMCVPGHCCMWEHPKKDHLDQIFVCKHSRKIHRCSTACEYLAVGNAREGYVCTLTGMVSRELLTLHYTRPSKDLSSKYLAHDHYIKMGKGQSKKRKQSAINKPPPSALILETLKSIFSGKERYKTYNTQKDRFFRESTKRFKKYRHQHINFIKTTGEILSLYKSFGSMLNPPMPHSPEKLLALSHSISNYWVKVGTSLARSPKTVGVFTAVCVSKLRTGYSINDIVIFPKVDWINRYSPSDINFSGLHAGIQCRSMSITWRKIQEKIICSKTNTPIHGMLFKMYEDI